MTEPSVSPFWRRGLWGNRDFMKLWFGETVSLFGSQVTALALPLTAIYTLNAGPAQMGWLQAAQQAPFFLLALFAGVWVDRVKRRPALIGTNLGQGTVLAVIPVLAWLGRLRLWHLYAVAFLMGILDVLFQLAYQAYMPSLVGREEILEGNSKMQLSSSAASVAGPSVAGPLVELITAPVAVAIDAASFFVAATAEALIRKPETAPAKEASRPALWSSIGEGLRVALGDRYLRAMLGEAATYNLFGTAVGTLTALFATRQLGLRPAVLGAAMAVGSVTWIIGSLLAAPLTKRLGYGRTLFAAYVAACAAPLVIPLAGGPVPVAASVLAVSFLFSGIGLSLSNIQVVSLRQAIIPRHLFARVNASYRFFAMGAAPVGALLGGFLGQAIGLRAAIAVCAAGTLLALPWVVASPIPALRVLPAGQDDIEKT